MKTLFVFPIIALIFAFSSCSDKLESGHGYPALELGDTTFIFKIDKVMQNDIDVKQHFSFFDNVKLTLSYKDGKPETFTLTESGAPFRVTSLVYTDLYQAEWEINTASTPYEIRKKGTGELLCYITRDRLITFPFKLGCQSTKYEYQLRPVDKN